MQSTEKEAFGRLLMVTGELYGKEVSPALVKLYWKILQHYDWPEVYKAFEVYVKNPDTGQFMPKPADIVRCISGNSGSRSLKAWSRVEYAISRIGPYRSVVFDDCLIHGVLKEMGGWIRLCQVKEKELPFVAKEFMTRYVAFCNKPPSSVPPYFAGLAEHQNAQYGFKAQPPLLIGNQEKAKRLFYNDNEPSKEENDA